MRNYDTGYQAGYRQALEDLVQSMGEFGSIEDLRRNLAETYGIEYN